MQNIIDAATRLQDALTLLDEATESAVTNGRATEAYAIRMVYGEIALAYNNINGLRFAVGQDREAGR